MFATIHPHDLRHAFVTLSLDAGASLRDVQDAACHADPGRRDITTALGTTWTRHPTYLVAGIGQARMLKPANPFAIRSVSKIEQEVRS